jgi:AmmeMemoRadiSam system protein A
MSLPKSQQQWLLAIALASIRHGLDKDCPLLPRLENCPAECRVKAATFVTLQQHKILRGCIGHLQPVAPLAEDVARNAYAAAFADPRFPRLQPQELQDLDIHIAILSPAEPLQVDSEQDLFEQLRPGIDGLILEDDAHKATFLPSVWEQLPEPRAFVHALKRKAGIAQDQWSTSMRSLRYQTQSFGDRLENIKIDQSGLSL